MTPSENFHKELFLNYLFRMLEKYSIRLKLFIKFYIFYMNHTNGIERELEDPNDVDY